MKAALFTLLIAWAKRALESPYLWGLLGVAAAIAVVAVLAFLVGQYLESKETRVAIAPLYAVAGLSVLVVASLWAFTDVVLDAFDQRLISERLLLFLVPGELRDLAVLRDLLGLDVDVPLLLPPAVSLPLGLVVGGFFYVLLVSWFGRTLSELKALEQKPDYVLRRERLEAKKRAEEAKAAGKPISEEAVISLPLSDDRFGRLFKTLGHWTSVEFVETRFLRWQEPLVRTLTIVLLIAAVAALHGDLSIPFWVGAAIVLDSLRRSLRTPKAPRPTEPLATEDAPESEAVSGEDDQVAALLEELQKSIGTLAEAPQDPTARPPRSARPSQLPARKLLDELERELGLAGLYAHQGLAANAAFVSGRNVLVATPPLSGRRVLMDLMMFYTALAEGRRVLYLASDSAAAARAEARFNARAQQTHWKWNILATNLADRAGRFDPTRSQPTLIFADPQSLHREIIARDEAWRTYLAGLGLVVLPDLHQRYGVVGAHLAHLLRRLRRAVHRAHAISAGNALQLPRGEDERVRFLATADPAYRDLGGFAERVVGRPFVVIGPESDGAPRPAQLHRVLPRIDPERIEDRHPALWVRDAARRAGLTAALVGYEASLTEAELGERQSLADARIVITRAPAARYAVLPVLTSHIGWRAASSADGAADAPGAGKVVVLWQPEREPFAELLAAELPKPGAADLGRGCTLVVAPHAREIERVHLACTLAEDEVSHSELSRLFSHDVLQEELTALRRDDRLQERTRTTLDVARGRIVESRTVTLTGGHEVHAEAVLTVSGPAWELVDHSTGEVLRHLEAERALATAYPGRVFVHQGQRYGVLPPGDQDQRSHRRVLCTREAQPLLTSPVRQVSVEPVERRTAELGVDSPAIERRVAPTRNLGGVKFTLQHRDVKVMEKVLGLRRFSQSGVERDTTFYDEPIICRYRTRATLMGLRADELDGFNDGTLHALTHLLRTVVPAFVRHEEEDLIISDVFLRTKDVTVPTLAFIDAHPGGAGFADAIDLEVLRHVARWSLALVRRCPARCESKHGCPSCLDIWRCHAPPSHYRLLDKRGAERALDALLGARERV